MNNKINNILPNGGFPPLILCKKEVINKKSKISKERLFSSNINIKELVSNTNKKPLILFEEKNIIEEITSI